MIKESLHVLSCLQASNDYVSSALNMLLYCPFRLLLMFCTHMISTNVV